MASAPGLRCVADCLVEQSCPEAAIRPSSKDLFCKQLEWTADGTCLVSVLSNSEIQTIIVPPDLLDGRDEPHNLQAYCSVSSSEPVKTVTSFPGFDLQDSATTLVLSAARDLPVRLTSAVTGEKLASYPLINPMTEEYISPHALTFSGDGSRFVAGSDSLVSVFDLSRPGQEPILSSATGPKRKTAAGFNPSTSMRGIVSALNLGASSDILAAGTFSRTVALYSAGGQGECIGAFTVVGNEADEDIGGRGITQLAWSPCERYLYIAERMSTGIMMYDIRKTGQLLCWLQDRQALTNQRLTFDTYGIEGDGQEVLAGGTDGVIRTWKNAQLREGPVPSDWEIPAHTGMISGTFSELILI